MVNSDKFGKRLERIMQEYELTASAFADQVDVGRSSISHILSGRNKPSLEFVMKVIEAFPEVELYWLLNGKGTFPKTKIGAPEMGRPTVPNLFDEEKQQDSRRENREETVKTMHQAKDTSGRQISRIVVFYTDGTFENFKNEN